MDTKAWIQHVQRSGTCFVRVGCTNTSKMVLNVTGYDLELEAFVFGSTVWEFMEDPPWIAAEWTDPTPRFCKAPSLAEAIEAATPMPKWCLAPQADVYHDSGLVYVEPPNPLFSVRAYGLTCLMAHHAHELPGIAIQTALAAERTKHWKVGMAAMLGKDPGEPPPLAFI